MKFRVLLTIDARCPKGKVRSTLTRAINSDPDLDVVAIVDCDEAAPPKEEAAKRPGDKP